MNLYFFDDEDIIIFDLPYKKVGNFWMSDKDNNNIINISSEDGNWIISGSENTKIITENNEGNVMLTSKNYYIVEKNQKRYLLYVDNMVDDSFEGYIFNSDNIVKIGNAKDNNIIVNNPYVLEHHFSIAIENGKWKIEKEDDALLYLNNNIIKDKITYINNGDTINMLGIRIVFANGIIFINNPFNNIQNSLPKKELIVDDELTDEEIKNEDLYQDEDYFLKSPRMRKTIETFNMSIDSPPPKNNIQETPLIMTLGPMLTMGASSLITLTNTLEAISSKEKTLKQSIPSLVITISMILAMFVWPYITRAYEKRRRKKAERERQEKYKAYIENKKEELEKEFVFQKKTLEENLVSTNVCYDVIINKRRTLWERKIDQSDFLTVRVGKGEIPFNANISYHSEDFTMDEDDMKKMLNKLIEDYKTLDNVPIGFSFLENNLTAINGILPKYVDFTKNILLQMMSFHSYDNLKIVLFTNKKNEKRWEFLKESPYCFSDDKSIRFFATNTEEMQEVSKYLESVFNGRYNYLANNNDLDISKLNTYYLVLVDDINLARRIGIIDSILEARANVGFSLIVVEEKLSKIPSEVNKFITIGESVSVILNSENDNQTRFTDEVTDEYDMQKVTEILSNVPIFIDSSIKQLPNTITFLEMYCVGQIEQLNVLNRWKANDPVKSLKAEVGINENGTPFVLDIHEKYHGPHGLIAGMTGSGKSEFIITYVLSMAINYSPEEVNFVLIDYKGGGLAGAFADTETGIKLPHVVGTITNLDKAEINRALSSIKSELRRRQEKFNEVRDQMGESTIDIYKYQKMYREGSIKEPIPHLIIVCDEFAELKDQQPDFMEDLISTARIGRSLGVHLILATQKPSGVVDSQIWSNSKFKICLKVQDKSDSLEMIKNELAAELKNVGRFYLQVGYNEYFAMGQAAWAGAQYYPSKEFKKNVDKNLYFIDNVGSIDKTINNSAIKKSVESQGEELTNIVKYLIDITKDSNYQINQLWLDRIPAEIYIQSLYKKYNHTEELYDLNPVVGEYDNPSEQKQGLLTLPISKDGNTIIYGMTDSGKDELLQSIVYSLITHHSSDELNLYLLDFGAETLTNFTDAPQVGDVILNTDDEKISNLIKLLNTELNKRKKLFAKYNGNYQDYIKNSNEKLPNIVVVINSFEVMNELYLDIVERYVPVIRDGSKYGIYFIITTDTQNGMKMKVSQSCKQVLCLQMNNEMAYKDILGRTDGLVPTNIIGRGLVKLDKVCEFQSASISSSDTKFNNIKLAIDVLNSKNMNKAMSVPIMPDTINISKFMLKYKGINSIPIGIAKESLIPTVYNFSKNSITLISTNEFSNFSQFLPNFMKTLEFDKTFDKIVIDANNFFDSFEWNLKYTNNNFDNFINELSAVNDKYQEILKNNSMNVKSLSGEKNTLCVIIGLDKFLNRINDESKEKLQKVLKDQVETLKLLFVFIDTPSSFKKYEYDEWYKSCVNANDGIWVGQGLNQQFAIKTSVQISSYSNIDNEHCAVVKNGMPVIVKTINEIKISSSED